ncbi:MAG TPA: carbonate dehydratase [Chitinophagaceae bacterium]|nr:carbonate dehydratase [Chitinophagaceae bacterium]HAN39331.1 carbonate dehydratase [Chitinophagaceae bacterium]
MEPYERLLLMNKGWVHDMLDNDPSFFNRLADIQKPDFLWIGCSDSRVSADAITGTSPGEIFVHRNIANMVVHTDLNLLSVLEFAVEHLKVKHIIVCGHYGCGGIKAAMTKSNYGILNKWLRNIKDVYRYHRTALDSITDQEQRTDKLVEFNVQEQVMNLAKTSIVQSAWKKHQWPHLHGWVYGLKDGLLKSLMHIPPNTTIDDLYEYEDLH